MPHFFGKRYFLLDIFICNLVYILAGISIKGSGASLAHTLQKNL